MSIEPIDRSGKEVGPPYTYTTRFSYPEKCQCVILTIDSLNTVVAAVYRPPGTQLASFKKLLSWIQEYLESSKNPDIYITGDFNLPNINWETLAISRDLGTNGTSSAQALLDHLSANFFSQLVDTPTRLNNILDLVVTNRSHYVAEIESTTTKLSDHNLVCVKLAQREKIINHLTLNHLVKPRFSAI